MPRMLPSWLDGLKKYAEETESPEQYWLWGGLSTLASALQRKVWLQFGMKRIYPNLYVLLVGPPAQRKDAAISFSRDILADKDLDIPLAPDSMSKRRFTSSLAKTGDTETFYFNGKPMPQCAMTVTSGEFSDLFAVNMKEMVECLTSVYDSRDVWIYSTEGKGEDKLYNVCVNLIAATTPGWMMDNLPQSAIGGGFTSRFAMIFADEVQQRFTIPWVRNYEDLSDSAHYDDKMKLYRALKNDLLHIHRELIGEFIWTREAYESFDLWYKKIDSKLKDVHDERLHPFVGRMHVMVLKVAMALRVGISDTLLLEPPEIEAAIGLLDAVLATASDAFGGHGRSKMGPDTQRVMGQLRVLKSASFKELMKLNYRHLNKTELQGVLATIESMGLVRVSCSVEIPDGKYLWLGKEGRKE